MDERLRMFRFLAGGMDGDACSSFRALFSIGTSGLSSGCS